MIRFINCMTRRPDISREQFREFWEDEHFIELIERIAEMTGAKLWTRNLTLIVEANDLVSELRGSRNPPDGVLEYCWEDTSRLTQITSSESGRALNEEMLSLQRKFVDLDASTAFFMSD